MAAIGFGLASGAARSDDGDCDDWAAVVEKISGIIEVQRANQSSWTRLALNDRVCFNEPIRSLPYSLATFRLPNDTTENLNANGSIVFRPPEDESRTLLDVTRAMFHIISRRPRALTIKTPHVNAGLRGTEFYVRVDGNLFELAVYDGVVELESASDVISVPSGYRIVVLNGELGEPERDNGMRQDLLWALHYPAILDGPLPEADSTPPASDADAAFLVGRAHSRMRVGQIAAARADLADALALRPKLGDALAIETVILLAEGSAEAARQSIARALANAPQAPSVLLARSLVLMHDGDVRGALAAAEQAVVQAPGSALAHARLAEVILATGDAAAAVAEANEALAIEPGTASAYEVLGFASLADGSVDGAVEEFRQAIALDSSAPLPRIGLAIEAVRSGREVDAREQLEIAVALNANDSLVRSYVGKLYFDELRSELAESQFEFAKNLDAEDPTPSLYQALFRQSQNRPIEAVADFIEASAANANSPVFRSGMLADDDLQIRNASIARSFRAVGFGELADRQGTFGIVADPLDFASHGLVADVASEFPRHQIPLVSETFQARMLQPLNVLPMRPQLAQPNLFIMDSTGPSELIRAESRRSFARNGLNLQFSAVGASNDTSGESLVLSGLFDNLAIDIGQFQYKTPGFRSNNDMDHRTATAFIQYRMSADTGLQGELRSARTVHGDTKLLFFSDNYDSLLRQREETDSIQFGLAHDVSSWSKLLATVRVEDIEVTTDSSGQYFSFIGGHNRTAEFQYLYELPRWNLVNGVRAIQWDYAETSRYLAPIPDPPFVTELTNSADVNDREVSTYSYAHRRIKNNLFVTIGASVDELQLDQIRETRVDPKLGLMWHPLPDTYLRVAAFRTLQGRRVSKQLVQPSLEPMQVGGFNQYVFDAAGERARNFALGIDHALKQNLRVGAEVTERNLETPFYVASSMSGLLDVYYFDVREVAHGANLYWTPRNNLAIKTGWRYEDFDYHGMTSPFGFNRLETTRIPVETTLFLGRFVSLRLLGTRIRQQGLFFTPVPVPSVIPGRSQFWVYDASVDVLLPNRRGTIEIGVKNLFDKSFQFQDTDPENPQVFPERFALARFSLSF